MDSGSALYERPYMPSASREYTRPLPPTPSERLLTLCTPPPNGGVIPQRSNDDFAYISELLQHTGRDEWARRPRTYVVLMLMGKPSFMDSFIVLGLDDNSFPYRNKVGLPIELQSFELADQFLEYQKYVLTEACDLEKGEDGAHIRLDDGDTLFNRLAKLGTGSTGTVDKVQSKLSGQLYARKKMKRHRDWKHDKALFGKFEKELAALKRLNHDHLVKVHGSYTDLKFIALLLTPVAERTLQSYLHAECTVDMPLFRTYFGCLANAVAYLHEKSIVHRDMKPQNILLYRDKIVITDFGTAWDWSGTENSSSMTLGDSKAKTVRYQSPECYRGDRRRSSSDIWSLGVVFLEMFTVLRGETVEAMDRYFERNGSFHPHVFGNPEAADSWLNLLSLNEGQRSDNLPLKWITQMCDPEEFKRPKAADLFEHIADEARGAFCGRCCKEGSTTSGSSSFTSEVNDDDEPTITQATSHNVGSDVKHHIASTPVNFKTLAYHIDEGVAFIQTKDHQPSQYGASDEKEAYPNAEAGITTANLSDPSFFNHTMPEALMETYLSSLAKADRPEIEPIEISDMKPPMQNKRKKTAPSISTIIQSFKRSNHQGSTHIHQSEGGNKLKKKQPADSSSHNGAEIAKNKKTTFDEEDLMYFEPEETDIGEQLFHKQLEEIHLIEEQQLRKQLEEINTAEKQLLHKQLHEINIIEEQFSPQPVGGYQTCSPERAEDIANLLQHSQERLSRRRSDDNLNYQTQSLLRSVDLDAENSLRRCGSDVNLSASKEDTEYENIQQIKDQLKEFSVPVHWVKRIEAVQSRNSSTPPVEKDKAPSVGIVESTLEPIPESKSAAAQVSEAKYASFMQPTVEDEIETTEPAIDTSSPLENPRIIRCPPIAPPPVSRPLITPVSIAPEYTLPTGTPKVPIPSSNALKSHFDSLRIPPPIPKPAASFSGFQPAASFSAFSAALTAGNLDALINEPERRRLPRVVLKEAEAYLKAVHNDAVSAAPTSVMSAKTKKHFQMIGFMLPMQDRSVHYLEHYTQKGSAAAVRYLLKAGCNPGTKQQPRKLPIFYAVKGASHRHTKCVEALIKYNVDLNVQDASKRTPLQYAISHEPWSGYSHLIHILLAGGAQPNKKDGSGINPLLHILSGECEPLDKSHRDALALLLAPEYKTNVNGTLPNSADRPLHLAVRRKDALAVALLLEKDVDVNAVGNDNLTPLQLAAKSWRHWSTIQQLEITSLLLEKGANPNVKDKKGKSPLQYARLFKLEDVAKDLLEYGAV